LLDDKADIGFRIKRLNDVMHARANAVLSEYGLTFAQMKVLMFLKKRSGNRCLQKELEETFCVRHSTMTGIIKRLCAKGFATSEVDRSDRRMRNIGLTEKGANLAEQVDETHNAARKTLLRGFTEEQIRTLSGLLDAVYGNLTQS